MYFYRLAVNKSCSNGCVCQCVCVQPSCVAHIHRLFLILSRCHAMSATIQAITYLSAAYRTSVFCVCDVYCTLKILCATSDTES